MTWIFGLPYLFYFKRFLDLKKCQKFVESFNFVLDLPQKVNFALIMENIRSLSAKI